MCQNVVMHTRRVVAAAVIAAACSLGVSSSASAAVHRPCAKAATAVARFHQRQDALGTRISKLRTKIGNAPNATAAARLQARLGRSQARNAKIGDVIARIQAACGNV